MIDVFCIAHQMPGHQDIPLITPTSCEPSDRLTQQSRTALHLHAFYPDLLPDILQRLRANQCAVDVFVTVDSEVKRAEVQSILHSFDLQQTPVECVPNVGRDIYPFLDLCSSIIDQYDVIGHLHTKKSPHVTDGSDLVSRWRELLLGNLLGSDREPRMLDRIIGHRDKHPEVQIVFPDDPHVMGWGKNEVMARQLVSEDDFSGLPRQFDFPVGTKETDRKLNFLRNTHDAAHGAHVIYTDTWTSMGQEEETAKREKVFPPYQVNAQLVSQADKDVIVMHCLPAHRNHELTDEVADGPHSVIFPQAHNRLHAQNAILARLFGVA